MTYRSVDDLYAAKTAALENIHQQTRDLTPAQANFHGLNGSWSIAEIVEHLCLVEDSLLRLTFTLLKRTEDAGKTDPVMSLFDGPFQSAVDQSQTEKFITRDKFIPTGNVTISDSLLQLQTIETQFENLRPRIQAVDLTYASFPHWIFGPLNLGQWLAFLILHEERHLAQIRIIVATPGFAQILLKA